ncbi:MAG: DUF262 domain-containing protein [Firmicutes bacterium]|nr:DUF262 domain-containing protein [Bacillota bacterium]
MGSWDMTKYSVEVLNDDIKNSRITIPKYQRGAVWNKQQKEKLIDSMNKGFPFGSILLYENNGTRQIIDGLQRSTTIIEFVKNPALFFTSDNIDEKILNDIVSSFGVVGDRSSIIDELEELIKKWVIDNHHTMQDVERMQYGDLADEIISQWPTALTNRTLIKDMIKELFSDFQDVCKSIAGMEIPALVYQGDESLLPEIFERINSQGAKLTKQQIYSASWANDYVKLRDPKFDEIVSNNRDRYDNMLDESMELDDYNPTDLVRNKEVNIFELVFGFGKLISRKYPYLFNYDEKDKTKVESIGFNLINACLLQKSANMKSLNTNLKRLVGLETEKIELFLTRLIDAIDYIDKRLGAGTKFKGNTRSNSKVYPLHTEMQIVSIISTVFIARHVSYSVDDNGDLINNSINIDPSTFNQRWSNMKDTFNNNLMKIYTIDILGQKWKGSGDKKLDNILTDFYYYNRNVSWKEFEQILDVYYANLNSERNERKQVASPKEQEKLILNLIYSSIFTAADQNDYSCFDIEHIAPKNLMKEKICAYGEEFRLPISSIANLCLLPEYDNRTKKDKTIYQDTEYIEKIKDLTKIEEKYTFTIQSDLAWLEQEGLSESQFKEAYMKYLNNRFEKMKEKIRNNLFHS